MQCLATPALFVYGSLKPRGRNKQVLSRSRGTWQPATINGLLVRFGSGLNKGYLGLLPGNQPLRGYVFSAHALAHMWQALDEFEGVGYVRKTTQVLVQGRPVEAEAYFIDPSENQKLVPLTRCRVAPDYYRLPRILET